MAATSVAKLYRSVIDDVINNVREVFLDDGVDEQVLAELKQAWERKLVETKAVDHSKDEQTVINQSGSNGQSVITQNSTVVQRVNQNSGNRSSPYSREHQLANHSQPQTQYHVQQLTTQQSSQGRQIQQQQQGHAQAGQSSSGTRHIATTSSPLTQQLTLAPGSIVQPTLFQYTTGDGVEGQKTVTILPQKVTFAFNPQTVMSSPAAAATLALPPELTASLFQQLNPGVTTMNVTQAQTSVVQHTNQAIAVNSGSQVQFQSTSAAAVNQGTPANARASQPTRVVQLDGPNESSDDDEDDDDFRDNDDDHEDNDEDQNEDENEYPGEEEEPLNSEDDVSDEDPIDLFDTDNVVVCQYDKITRSRNKWKFHLKDGIMNLQSKDYVFQKAIGDAEW